MDGDLVSQIEPIHQLARAFDIPVFEKSGFEADDVIGTLARRANLPKRKTKNLEIVIVTGDKDIFQLIDKNTKIYILKRGISGGELVDQEKVKELLGVRPDQIVDYKALSGDPSDNYPGVAGIGPKTAKKLLVQYGTLKQIMDRKIIKDEKAALLSQKLAQIKKDVPLKFSLEKCRFDFNKEKIKEIFRKFHFESLVKKLDQEEQMRLI